MALTGKGRIIIMKYSYKLLHNTLQSKKLTIFNCGRGISLTPGSSRLPVSLKGGIGVEFGVE